MDRKTIILDLLNKAYKIEQEFINNLTESQKNQSGEPKNWSAKDVIAHNASWKERHSMNIIAVHQGNEPIRVTDYDQENERLFYEHNPKSWEEILKYAKSTQENLLDLAEELTPGELEQFGFLPWQEDRPLWRTIWGYSYSHPLVHLAEHYRNRNELKEAAELIGILADAMEDLDDSQSWHGAMKYNRACQYSLSGRNADAIAELSLALSLDNSLREWAKVDADLDPIRTEPGFQLLFQD